MTLPYEVVSDSSDRASWLEARRSGIGASEVAALLGESKWDSALSIYASKVGADAGDADEQTEAQFWGLRLERVIVEVYAQRTKRPAEWSGLMLRSREYPWLTCTLDALTGIDAAEWPVDAKNVSAFKAREWTDGPPRAYFLQLQQQMLITGAQNSTSACLLGGQRLVWADVERDEPTCKSILHVTRVFWEQCVQPGVPPEPDGSERSRQALQALYPEAKDVAVRLDAELEEPYEKLVAAKALEKAVGQDIERLEQGFKARLGSAERGLLPSGNGVAWSERRGSVSYKSAAEHLGATPSLLEEFRGNPTRAFRMQPKKER